jgi:hypothetical protein
MPRKRREEKEEQSAETTLAPQLGATPLKMAGGEWDIRKQSNLPNELIAVSASYFTNLPKQRGGRFARKFFDNLFHMLPSVRGWNVNKQVQMVGAAKGAPTISEIKKKPNILARHTTQRDWKEKAEEEGQIIVE